MRKHLLLLAIIFGWSIIAKAQIISSANPITVDTTPAIYPVVQKIMHPADISATQDTSKRITLWLEAGDGYFTTDPHVSYSPDMANQSHQPFMMATNLYDTTKGLMKPTRTIIYNATTASTGVGVTGTGTITGGVNDMHIPILGNSFIKITPNAYDIVRGDTMAFAITYKVPDNPGGTNQSKGDPSKPQVKDVKEYKLYFFYNNNKTFVQVTDTNQVNIMGTGSALHNCRVHNKEEISFKPTLPVITSMNDMGFSEWICYDIKQNNYDEKTVFVTMLPDTGLVTGGSGSVYAVLVENGTSIIARDTIANMPFRPAHDPNYLVQDPNCLELPKADHPFNYTVHFQNTGGGRAIEVKVLVHLPEGLNWSTLAIKKATFAGVDYTKYIRVTKRERENILEIVFKHDTTGVLHFLLGTIDSKAPALDEKTMGEIYFSFHSTPNTADSLKAYADIYFRSEHPSANATAEGYEKPVRTNTAVAVYKTCCSCIGPVPCYIILGLCWWWWLIILLILIIIFWLFIARKRKVNNSQYRSGNYSSPDDRL